jgi:YebC/PmpR family DNA-binding regulatory protein
MSGHSKWHNIQKKKGAADARRGSLFTKLSKAVTVAVREGGGDPSFNFSLRIAIDAAKAANVPKDNIEKAIKRGTGEIESGQIDEVVYEGFGPAGVAVLIKCLTDNRNRTVAEVKTIVNKREGTFANPGSVSWMFDRKGVVALTDVDQITDRDAFELAVIDAGAEDIIESDGVMQVVSEISDLQSVLKAVEALGMKVEGAGIEFLAKDPVDLSEQDSEKLEKFIDALDENDDVDTVYTNVK